VVKVVAKVINNKGVSQC